MDFLCAPFLAQIVSLLLVGVGHYWHLFVLDLALVIALNSFVARGGIRLGCVFQGNPGSCALCSA